MADKIFAQGLYVSEKKFANGGGVVKLGIKPTEFYEFLLKNKDSGSDFVNIDLNKTREGKMYACLDTYKKQ